MRNEMKYTCELPLQERKKNVVDTDGEFLGEFTEKM